MDKSYLQVVTEDRRLAILRVLAEATAYQLNASVIRKVLPGIGHATSADQTLGDLAWLEEQGLIVTDRPMETVVVATLTERGADAAKGHAMVPGVSKPSPRHL